MGLAVGDWKLEAHDLEGTIRRVPRDLVIAATPIDLARVAQLYHPVQRVRYELQVIGQPTLEKILAEKFRAR
jgi:predicted GTPase